MGTGKRAFRSASPLFFPPAEMLLQPANRHTVRKTNWSFVPRVVEAKRNKALYKEVPTDTRRRWPTHTGGFDLYISRSQLPQPFPKRVYVQVFAGECDVDAVQLVEFLSRFEAKKNYYRFQPDSDAIGAVYIPLATFGRRKAPQRCTLAIWWDEEE